MDGNFIGEEIGGYTKDQINLRQTLYGAGAYTKLKRTNEVLNYTNNKNTWIKFASGVSVNGEGLKKFKSSLQGVTTIKDSEIEGMELARRCILFNGTSSLNPNTNKLTDRSGVTSSNLWNDSKSLYGGLGGITQGLNPSPGIIGMSVNCLNRGSIKKANIKIKAFNKNQFTIIEALYLKLGHSMILEWGWDRYASTDKKGNPDIKEVGNTLIEEKWFTTNFSKSSQIIQAIETTRGKYNGNYDGFFGKVVNFKWNYQEDGTYDISIDLITVGDVIESLNISVPQTFSKTSQIVKDTNTKFNENQTNSTLTAEEKTTSPPTTKESIFSTSASISTLKNLILQYKTHENLDDYLIDGEYLLHDTSVHSIIPSGKTIPYDYQRSIQFGKFIEQLEYTCIPKVKNGDSEEYLVEFASLKNAYISTSPNLIPIHPQICIFKQPVILEDSNFRNALSTKTYYYNSPSPNFIIANKAGNWAGQLKDVYLNLGFLIELVDSFEDEIPLFTFLTKICEGINKGMGNIPKIEPILKNDREIVFIDQNPIPLVQNSLLTKDPNPIALEISGYSGQQSTFVKDIKFETKITPQLASTIAVSATAGGNKTKNIDATSFSKWGEGFDDRFVQKVSHNTPKPSSSEVSKLGNDMSKIYKEAYDYALKKGKIIESRTHPYIKYEVKAEGKFQYYRETIHTRAQGDPDYDTPENKKAAAEMYANLHKNETLKSENEEADNAQIEKSLEENWEVNIMNYYGYAVFKQNSTVRISSEGKTLADCYTNSDLRDSLTKAYKAYLAKLKTKKYIEKGDPSTSQGFIPLNFNLTLEGISGVKIYNNLRINQSFLPPNYPSSMNFIITKVNHKIANNDWETQISTISVSNTSKNEKNGKLPSIPKNQPKKRKQTHKETYTGPVGPISGKSTKPFRIKENRSGNPNNGKYITKEQLLSDINESVRPNFTAFFTELEQNYTGYYILVNSLERTFATSKALKYGTKNPFTKGDLDNAEPGYSPHNYSAAMDFNLVTPDGESLPKDSKRGEWVKHGLPSVAKKHGLKWGGNFAKYKDYVHFYYDFSRKKAIAYRQNETEAERRADPYNKNIPLTS